MASPVRAHALGFIMCCLVSWTSSEKLKNERQCPLDVDYPNCKNAPVDLKPECKKGGKCEGGKICCYSGCTYRCLLPLQDKTGTCPYYNASQCMYIKPLPNQCHNDKQCQGSERCCCYNCGQRCTQTMIVKPGQCPVVKKCPVEASYRVSVMKPPVVKPRCQNDGNCTGTQKCCDSCGMKCVEPIKDHPGFCPVNNEQISCITTLGKPSCRNDTGCKKGEKCCLSDDRMQCVPAQKEKEGCCPKLSTQHTYSPSPKRCVSDSDCLGIQKCCSSANEKTCTDPITEVKPGTCPVMNTLVACNKPYSSGDCKKDCDCADKKKCCIQGCELKCIDV